ncbi:MAG TPA: hypothetical protein DC063_09550 [Arenimonas sp.]|nr:MAG: hypothetical protein A2X76_10905 [Xanthomonadales bacterium GWF1_69_6]HBD20292.1 hypothetical protein [Arenimonas sp.]
MIRILLLLCLAAGAAALPQPTLAQSLGGERAYAPEDLRQLRVPDRIRVLEKEYREQSNGRSLPDDQLEFYLDQIESGWTFSRIKSDMARSLAGSGGNRPPNGGWGPPDNWQARSVICSSVKNRYAQCATPFRGRARLVENLSKTRCVENQNWGSRKGMVWVDNGCRGRFSEGRGWGPEGGYNVTCSSINGRYTTCAWNASYGEPRLQQRLSNSACDEGRDWGYRRGQLWVDNGCRARFGVR